MYSSHHAKSELDKVMQGTGRAVRVLVLGSASLGSFPVLAAGSVAVTVCFAYLTGDALFGHSSYSIANQLGPALLFVSCAYAAYALVRRNHMAVWSPAPWFLLTAGTYYGLGPLSYYFATAESVAYMDAFFPVDEWTLFRTNLLNAVGLGSVCMTIALVLSLLPADGRHSFAYDHALIRRVMWLFLAVGAVAKYTFTLPNHLGLLSWTLPGVIQHLNLLLHATIVLLFVLIRNGEPKYKWLLYSLIASELISGFMTFSKLEVILTALAVALGFMFYRPNLKIMIGSGILLFSLYAVFLSPFVSYARLAFDPRGIGDPQELIIATSEYRAAGREVIGSLTPGVQGWWTRLSYSNAQGFAMGAYDSGAAGHTFGLLPYAFVPRLIFPDKPIMTIGDEFTLAVTGDPTASASTSTAAGVFGEAYWNGGWMAVLGVCAYLGVLFGIFSRFSMGHMARGQYAYMPVAIAGVIIGLQPDAWFVPTYVGAVAEAIAIYLVVRCVVLPVLRLKAF